MEYRGLNITSPYWFTISIPKTHQDEFEALIAHIESAPARDGQCYLNLDGQTYNLRRTLRPPKIETTETEFHVQIEATLGAGMMLSADLKFLLTMQ